MPVAQGASPRLFLAGFVRPRAVPGVFSLSEGLRPSRCRRAIRAGRTHGPCVPTAGVAVAFGYGFYGSSRRGLRRDMPGGAYLF